MWTGHKTNGTPLYPNKDSRERFCSSCARICIFPHSCGNACSPRFRDLTVSVAEWTVKRWNTSGYHERRNEDEYYIGVIFLANYKYQILIPNPKVLILPWFPSLRKSYSIPFFFISVIIQSILISNPKISILLISEAESFRVSSLENRKRIS